MACVRSGGGGGGIRRARPWCARWSSSGVPATRRTMPLWAMRCRIPRLRNHTSASEPSVRLRVGPPTTVHRGDQQQRGDCAAVRPDPRSHLGAPVFLPAGVASELEGQSGCAGRLIASTQQRSKPDNERRGALRRSVCGESWPAEEVRRRLRRRGVRRPQPRPPCRCGMSRLSALQLAEQRRLFRVRRRRYADGPMVCRGRAGRHHAGKRHRGRVRSRI
jgi:hypothetical protein